MECQFVTTKRGARSLLQGGFKYTLNRRGREGQIYWRCVDRKCPGRAVTNENDELVSSNNKHSHLPDDIEIKASQVVGCSDTLYADGNFEICPRLFYQILTIHAFKHGKQFPLAYFLLPGKSRDVYNTAFALLHEAARSHLPVQPSQFLTDFEKALLQSISINFPAATVKGCFYHFAQAIWRKVQLSGLQISYQEEEEFRKFFRKVISLALVPPRYLRLGWAGLKAGAPADDRVAQFKHYFEETWLNGHYHISEWCVWGDDGPRTNNHVEGWHDKINRPAGKSHPNIYELVELFKAEQAVTEVTLRQLEAGGVVAPTRRVFRLKEKRLRTIQEKFANNEYTLDEYIALSNWVGFR